MSLYQRIEKDRGERTGCHDKAKEARIKLGNLSESTLKDRAGELTLFSGEVNM